MPSHFFSLLTILFYSVLLTFHISVSPLHFFLFQFHTIVISTSCIHPILHSVIPLSLTLSSLYFSLSLSLSLYSQGRPWPHSFISLQDRGSTLSDYSKCSALSNIPSLCFPTTLTSVPPPVFSSLALLALLSRSNLSPKGSDWQASGGLVKGSFWLDMVKEMKKPPGSALTALQKQTYCNYLALCPKVHFKSSASEVASAKSTFSTCVVCCVCPIWQQCHPKRWLHPDQWGE